jgi:hypothetical protein
MNQSMREKALEEFPNLNKLEITEVNFEKEIILKPIINIFFDFR